MISGILLIDKEEGLTSTDVDRKVGHLFNTKKVGHLGTLDPFATGLLIIAVNKGTKYLQFIPDGEKTYRATLRLGIETSTGDKTGEIKEKKDVPELKEAQIAEIFEKFIGKQKQIPPMTSSIKINGKALYKLAHKGIEIERKPRDIEVFSLSLNSYQNNEIDFTCRVSKGTYVRTLGEDIAKVLGTVGHLTTLRRLEIGSWNVNDAKKVTEIFGNDFKEPSSFVTEIPHVFLSDIGLRKMVRNGMSVHLDLNKGERQFLFDEEGDIAIYIYNKEDGFFHSERGFN